MACYPVQCLVAPCPEVCDDGTIVGGTGEVSGPYVNQTLPYRNIDTRLLMYPPSTRTPGSYTGGQYPSTTGSPYVPDFTTEVVSLDWWRLAILALGIVVGAVIIKKA